ncbi:glycosyltransferase family 2 protein [Novosphingobium mangrovi (ex Huang et al. 2023)]|uniref:Glycosyltransferase n=1 Tax=Novosphingobium mangrovi (ex Huang et al. 2023) TaxID=2976432 RepID=A0ABT2I9L7_9SPHN|nr:glycosyltransferase [Novosphingobium mangrovi (ex Huang et al. 2023)]MCT2401501.1 glycosyltransferase [Novosphingobium mangrovi (ex Huang et al. 2023)]
MTASYRKSLAPLAPREGRPRWSVMIPTYNCARYLERTLESVLAQDPGPQSMQIEVVDDASTSDDPGEVVARVGRGRVQFRRQGRNVGHIANFHDCIEHAQGEIVHLLHGDDLVFPGFYEAMGRAFDTDPEIGAAFCRWSLMDENGQVLSSVDPEQPEAGRLPNALCKLASEQRIVTPSIAVRRSVWERLGTFDSRLKCCEDWEMWTRIAAHYPIWYEPRLLAAYRTHGNSNTGRNFRMAEELYYNRIAIDLIRPLLPADRAPGVVKSAEKAYAASALENARRFASQRDLSAMRAHLAAALRLSRTPKTLLSAGKILMRAMSGSA